jgi:tripeptide aminopeptidase
MHEILRDETEVIERAEAAIRRAGLEVCREPLRGGSDGSLLCFMGLPTPNLFAGQHNFHSNIEWISTFEMDKAVEVIIELCRVWEEHAA